MAKGLWPVEKPGAKGNRLSFTFLATDHPPGRRAACQLRVPQAWGFWGCTALEIG